MCEMMTQSAYEGWMLAQSNIMIEIKLLQYHKSVKRCILEWNVKHYGQVILQSYWKYVSKVKDPL